MTGFSGKYRGLSILRRLPIYLLGCDVCRSRTNGSAGKQVVPRYILISTAESMANCWRVCRSCWQRHLELGELKLEERIDQLTLAYRGWLNLAPGGQPAEPERPHPPDWTPASLPPRPGQEPGTIPFADVTLARTRWDEGRREDWVLDIDVAARQLALWKCGVAGSYLRPPTHRGEDLLKISHHDALGMSYDLDGGASERYVGSVFRLGQDRIVIKWTYEGTLSFD
ncbi:hypothetical protein [Asanoa sp. NPDC050611]|uniref:hypothetical protein n=1 Tax=Asanoa sp. NPDC050611 TaxID=3157098 RepID=UPI0033C965AE